MNETIASNIRDLSDSGEFRFAASCTVCGKTWISTPTPFSKAEGIVKSEVKKFFFMKCYHKEKRSAMAAAIKEAKSSLNFCPVCRSLVCDDCFMICEHDDMCIDCASYFHEKGERVD